MEPVEVTKDELIDIIINSAGGIFIDDVSNVKKVEYVLEKTGDNYIIKETKYS